ncbi:hypothetical protein [Gandjariella thermophila]|uniref:Uncharacterized protein n=1 Tax=Gandjariella thermophila TaxID=1931992 RepID=A0A4D4J7B4_9PSEU|nr:hypothetical protein [Gandjariella thermophila]GDY30406.1 hypothetical protein GTS_20390 [Gandjariella thermophila]
MSYRWRYQDASGRDVTGPDLVFDDQTDAEDWLGINWAGLLESGVEQVTLLHTDAEVYGPMSLRPAEPR